MSELLDFSLDRPHTMHEATGKVRTFDQNGVVYDGITLKPLDHKNKTVGTKYAIPEGAPFTAVKTDLQKVDEAMATLRASGMMNGNDIAKLEGMMRKAVGPTPVSESDGTPES